MKLPPPDRRHGWAAWLIFFAVLCVLLVVQPGRKTVTGSYFPIARLWWDAQQDIYSGGFLGFLYLPQSVHLFTPFAWLPNPLDEALWRLLGLALFAVGLNRTASQAVTRGSGSLFVWATLLALPTVFSSARNGQSNLHLIGFMLLAGADLADRRWWRATAFLWLGMAAKPLGLVPILLVGALYRAMGWRLLVGAAVFAALPFLHVDWPYVARQYGLAFDKLLRSVQPAERVHAELMWALQSFGVNAPGGVRLAVRGLAALGILGLCWIARRRGGALQGAFLLTAFAACYLTVFNPRTETNSYVILIPFPALLAVLTVRASKGAWGAAFLVAVCLALACDNYGRVFHELTSPWLKPLAGFAFLLFLALRVRTLREHPLLPRAAARETTRAPL